MKDLRARYLADLPGKLDELEEAIVAAQTHPELLITPQRMAHSLAGSGATFGVVAVSTISRKIEHQLLEVREGGGILLPDMAQQMLAAVAELQSIASEANANAQAQAPMTSVLPPSNTLPRKKICVIENELHVAEDLRLQLGYFGYDTQHFLSPQAFADHGLPAGTEAILCDVIFPEGATAGPERMRELAPTVCPDVPLLFMSSNDDMASRLKVVRAGGKAFLTKPVDMTALVTHLDRFTGGGISRSAKVLVVDDSPNFAKFYADVLEHSGMKTRTLTDPMRIIEALSEFQPDLILLDMYMPDCTGVELARVLRQQEAYVSVPIVYLSAENNVNRQLDAMTSGADDFLQKPIEPEHLVASIRARTDRHAQLRSYIVKDSLTNLLNHSRLREALDVELARAERSGSPVSFAMIDIDHFKSINDRYGHPVGDHVLRALARMLNQRLRKTDIAGRYGGEEFGVVLSDTDAATAVRVIDVLREDFSQIRHLANADTEFRVTFSAGIAEFPAIRGVNALSRAADVALYEAKRKGRNRVEASLPPRN